MPPYRLSETQDESPSDVWIQFYVNGGIDLVDKDTGEVLGCVPKYLGEVLGPGNPLGTLAYNRRLPDFVREFFGDELEIDLLANTGVSIYDFREALGPVANYRSDWALRAMILFLQAGLSGESVDMSDPDSFKMALEQALNLDCSISSGNIRLEEKVILNYHQGWDYFKDKLTDAMKTQMSQRMCLNYIGRSVGHARRVFDIIAFRCNYEFWKASPNMISECMELYMENAFDFYESLYVRNHSRLSK